MNRTAVVLISLLLTSTTYPGTVRSTISPPAQALSAGFRKLAFDEEFKGPFDIGYGTSGRKWNAACGENQFRQRALSPSGTAFLR